jgi:serine/threonine protein kinase
MAIEVGDLVVGLRGTYRVEARHGEGTFGIAYRASQESTGGRVIVKVLRLEKLDDWKALDLFEREGRVLATLSHPNVPAFCDFFVHGEAGPLPVSAMASEDGPARVSLVLVQEFIEGTTLQQRVDLGRRLGPDAALAVLRALLGALTYLHGCTPPVVHRDIKPSNVILTPEGKPYLVDFGAIQGRTGQGGGG